MPSATRPLHEGDESLSIVGVQDSLIRLVDVRGHDPSAGDTMIYNWEACVPDVRLAGREGRELCLTARRIKTLWVIGPVKDVIWTGDDSGLRLLLRNQRAMTIETDAEHGCWRLRIEVRTIMTGPGPVGYVRWPEVWTSWE